MPWWRMGVSVTRAMQLIGERAGGSEQACPLGASGVEVDAREVGSVTRRLAATRRRATTVSWSMRSERGRRPRRGRGRWREGDGPERPARDGVEGVDAGVAVAFAGSSPRRRRRRRPRPRPGRNLRGRAGCCRSPGQVRDESAGSSSGSAADSGGRVRPDGREREAVPGADVEGVVDVEDIADGGGHDPGLLEVLFVAGARPAAAGCRRRRRRSRGRSRRWRAAGPRPARRRRRWWVQRRDGRGRGVACVEQNAGRRLEGGLAEPAGGEIGDLGPVQPERDLLEDAGGISRRRRSRASGRGGGRAAGARGEPPRSGRPRGAPGPGVAASRPEGVRRRDARHPRRPWGWRGGLRPAGLR